MTAVKKIAVVGLGYVGLPLALLADEKGFDVIGLEVNKSKLAALRSRKPIIDDVTANEQLRTTKAFFTDDFSKLSDCDVVTICVPTPVDEEKNPDLDLVKAATLSCAKHMSKGSLLVIESTINPGVCDEVLIPLIEKETAHVVGESLFVAHCPERINPGDPKWHVGNINRVLGADSEAGLNIAYNFYSKLVDAKIKKMGTIREAEAVKVVENSFRDINIAFVNELAMSFDKLGINVTNVIDGAATKPFGFMPFYPGIGVGGHCIPVDPYYLIEYAKNNGFDHKFLSLARSINEAMPTYAVDSLEKAYIEKTGKTLKGSKVLVLGISYKPDVSDDRESPAHSVIEQLEARGAQVSKYDPFFLDKSDAPDAKSALATADAAILVTGHSEFKKLAPGEFQNLHVFFDGRNLFSEASSAIESLGVNYVNLGG